MDYMYLQSRYITKVNEKTLRATSSQLGEEAGAEDAMRAIRTALSGFARNQTDSESCETAQDPDHAARQLSSGVSATKRRLAEL